MNIEELNNCFDSITPTKEQKERMLTAVMNSKKQPVKVVKLNRYKYMSAAAAVIAVGIFAAVYSNLGDTDYINDTASTVAVDTQTDKNKSEGNIEDENLKYADKSVEELDKLKQTGKFESEKAVMPEKVDSNLLTDESNPLSTENKQQAKADTFTEILAKEYPELTDENVKTEKPAVALEENKNIARSHDVPQEENVQNEDMEDASSNSINHNSNSVGEKGSVASSGGGGGGGSAGGGSISATRKSLTLSQITSDSVYSTLFPTTIVNGFAFTGAYKTEKIMEAHFEATDGRYMSVSVVENGKYNVYQQIVAPSQIADMTADGYMEFAVKCGNYYVIYYVETDSASEVYEMVTSSAYFK